MKSEWKSTVKKPLVKKPINELKKLVDDLRKQFKKTRIEIQKLKNDTV